MNYIPLQVLSGYTFMESALKVSDIIDVGNVNHYGAMGIADTGSLCGFPSFDAGCKKVNLKPVFGCGLILLFDAREFLVYVYVANEKGYRNLCYLSSYSGKLTLNDFDDHSEGLILVLPSVSNPLLNSSFVNQSPKLAAFLFAFKKKFEDIYLGIEIYSSEDKDTAEKVRAFASDHSYKTICFPRHLYVHRKDALAIKILHAVKNDEKLDSRSEENGPYYFLSEKAVNQLYTEEEIKATHELASRCQFEFMAKRGHLYVYPLNEDKKAYLKNLSVTHLKELNKWNKTYEERLSYELDVIEKMGFLDYFLIVRDYVMHAKENHIPVGPGRGSAAGALVSYALQITEVDPLEYNLYFERFLNPERVTMPDIDVDFSDVYRDDVVAYIISRFGKEKAAKIITFQPFGAKQAIRDIGRVFSYNSMDISHLSSIIEDSLGTLDEAFEKYPALVQEDKDSYFHEILALADKIDGLPRQSGQHAAGILLNNDPIMDGAPVKILEDGTEVVQYEYEYLEAQGFLKMDILSLINLTLIEVMTSLIHQKGTALDIKSLSFDDEDVYALLNKGFTKGIFQVESYGMTQELRKVELHQFDDLVAILALYRPGPMEFIDDYAKRKNQGVAYDCIHPSLEEILRPTYGIIVYQEQIMQIVQKVASFSLGEADVFRRAISKKDASKMEGLKKSFTDGALKNGYSPADAEKIFALIEKFANYGFNKSHTVAYAIIAYQQAYLKARFPDVFYGVMLSRTTLNDPSAKAYLAEMKAFGLKVGLPDINKSSLYYEKDGDALRISFPSIKGLPTSVCEAILHERKENGDFLSLQNFVIRMTDYGVTLPHVITLINAGAFDSFGYNRNTLRKQAPILFEYAKTDNSMFSLLSEEERSMMMPSLTLYEEDNDIRNEKEIETIGILLSGSYFEKYQNYRNSKKITDISDAVNTGDTVNLLVKIGEARIILTKKKDNMAFLDVYDDTGNATAIAFPKVYQANHKDLDTGFTVGLRGHFQKDEKRGTTFLINEVEIPKEDSES